MARNRSQGRRSRSWWARSRNQNLSSNSAACCSEHVTRPHIFTVEDGVWAMMPGCGCLIPFATEGESQGGRAMAPNDRFRGIFTLSLHRLSYTHSPPHKSLPVNNVHRLTQVARFEGDTAQPHPPALHTKHLEQLQPSAMRQLFGLGCESPWAGVRRRGQLLYIVYAQAAVQFSKL